MPEQFLSCDWGTSNFRLRLVDAESASVVRELSTPDGVDRISPGSNDRFRALLDERCGELIDAADLDLSDTPLWISGMASSSIGWRDVPYAPVPFALDGSSAHVADLGPLSKQRPCPVRLVSGLRTETDVLRGEETEALGILSACADDTMERERVLVLPGTHSKHLLVRGGAIVDFRTTMTGEVYEILRQHSILRHSVDDVVELDDDRERAFRDGSRRGAQGPLLSLLFSVRTRQLLHGDSPCQCGAYLSGLLLGSEMRAAGDLAGADAEVLLGVRGLMSRLYLAAAQEVGLGTQARLVDEKVLASAAPQGHAVLTSAAPSLLA